MDDILLKGFRCGAVRVSPLGGWIDGPGGVQHVQPKVMEVLLCLARTPGEVVGRDRIYDAVWSGQANADNALTHCISELRRVLHDKADEPTYVQTIPKAGYRLLAPVTAEAIDPGFARRPPASSWPQRLWEDLRDRKVIKVAIAYAAIAGVSLQVSQVIIDALDFPDSTLPLFLFLLVVGFFIAVVVAWFYQLVPERATAELSQRRRLKQAVDISIIAVLAGALGLLAYRQFVAQPLFANVVDLPEAMTAPPPREHSVAVLRFATLGDDATFSDGFSEHLLNLLGRVKGLQVPSRPVTWEVADEKLSVAKIAEALSVKYLLDGSVEPGEQRITVTAQLIDGSSGVNVWSESYDEALTANNFYEIQDAIAQQVVAKLEATLAADAKSDSSTRGTADNEALLDYLRGRALLNEPKTDESMTGAVAAFDAAIARDPHYAEAYAGLCEAQLAWYITYGDTKYFDAAEAACIRALRINQDLGEVYAALGSLHRNAGQLDEAEAELLEARQLLNDPTFVLEELGRTYEDQNKLTLAGQTYDEAIVKEPANWSVYKSMANFLFRTGRYAEALPYYKQVLVLQRDSAVAYSNIAAAFFMLGDFESASMARSESLELDPTHFAYMNYANTLYYQGRFAKSAEVYRDAIELGASDARAWGSLGASCQQISGEEACKTEAFSKAIELINKSLAINPVDAPSLSRLASYYARLGMHEEARETLARLSELNWAENEVPYFMALTHIALGDPRAAAADINRAVVLGYPRVLVTADPGLSSIRGEPEFIEVTE
jgi:tetratricopeptide (TPR) repeat protein/DNA-binding winged helix-turn-helix (wHTH) protein